MKLASHLFQIVYFFLYLPIFLILYYYYYAIMWTDYAILDP